MNRKNSRKRSLTRVFSDSAIINRALITAVAKAIDVHRRAGNKIVVMRTENGKQTSHLFDYKSVISGKNLRQNIELRPGDTVIVP